VLEEKYGIPPLLPLVKQVPPLGTDRAVPKVKAPAELKVRFGLYPPP